MPSSSCRELLRTASAESIEHPELGLAVSPRPDARSWKTSKDSISSSAHSETNQRAGGHAARCKATRADPSCCAATWTRCPCPKTRVWHSSSEGGWRDARLRSRRPRLDVGGGGTATRCPTETSWRATRSPSCSSPVRRATTGRRNHARRGPPRRRRCGALRCTSFRCCPVRYGGNPSAVRSLAWRLRTSFEIELKGQGRSRGRCPTRPSIRSPPPVSWFSALQSFRDASDERLRSGRSSPLRRFAPEPPTTSSPKTPSSAARFARSRRRRESVHPRGDRARRPRHRGAHGLDGETSSC